MGADDRSGRRKDANACELSVGARAGGRQGVAQRPMGRRLWRAGPHVLRSREFPHCLLRLRRRPRVKLSDFVRRVLVRRLRQRPARGVHAHAHLRDSPR